MILYIKSKVINQKTECTRQTYDYKPKVVLCTLIKL